MNSTTQSNTASITLAPGESFVFRSSILKGSSAFEICLPPPYPFGSPIARMLYGCYFGMKRVRATTTPMSVSVAGFHPRGSFFSIEIPAGEKHYINAHAIAGFSETFKGVHTHIKIAPVFWCVRKHFFTVFEGPGTVLLYSASPLLSTEELDFQPERIVSFDIRRTFTAVAPQSATIPTQIWNVFSRETVWRFLDEGWVVAENHSHDTAGHHDRHPLRRLFEHALGFFHI